MTDTKDRERDWTSWLEPLRPDDVTRDRVRGAVLREAAPRLRRRRRRVLWRTAGSLARIVAPAAAAAVLMFGWVAHEASGPALEPAGTAVAERPVEVEELVRGENGVPPAMLTSASAPSSDLVLEATLRPGESP